MKRFLVAIVVFFFLSAPAHAAHIIGGEMRYTYVSPGAAPNSKIYTITLILFRGDDPNGAALAVSYPIGIFNNDNGQKAMVNQSILRDAEPVSVPIIFPLCIQGAPTLAYTYASYSINIELPDNLTGYTIAYQTCCRINGMVNVGNSTGSTYNCVIPGSNNLSTGDDSSPKFNAPINVVCKNAPFTLDFSAVDPDPNDILVYSLCDAYNGGAAINAGFADPAPPPYGSVNYNSPYNSANPFGTGATINPQTGIISGLAPDIGKYVVCVCINVFRNNVLIATHRKDLIVQVSDCNLTTANPMPNFVTCDGFDVQFSHTSSGATTVFWDFGNTAAIDDTANTDAPSYRYLDTGVYNVKFVINRGTGCADSVTRKVGVFPGFKPGFISTGGCFTNPFQFQDTTKATFGTVNSWRWNFGDLSTLADTSKIKNPQWTYATAGIKDVSLIVTSTKGCIDTALVPVTVFDKPPITLAFKDTLICRPDAVQLNATGNGVFSWTPLISILNSGSGTPTVNPTATTKYYVHLNDNGCVNIDSVNVRVVSFVSITAMLDTTICRTDSVRLTAISDGLSFTWSPSATIKNPTALTTFATPITVSTPYQIEARIGSCRAVDDVIITTVPYPIADAGPPQIICFNTSARLNGSHDGSSFSWSPTSYLDNPNSLTPVASPPRTTQYVLSSLDTKGCPKPGRDTILVTVLPRVRAFAGRDTIVVVGQPLQFNGTGGIGYLWSPATGLTKTDIPNPVGVYHSGIDSVRYKLVVNDAAGCTDSAFVNVKVFKTIPYVFVPTAFTPNGDGLNDVVRPIAVGIQKINYFSIFNRWGQLVFKTTINGYGWDGRIKGLVQGTNVFVWMVSAIDYTGKPLFLKGTVTLIR
jgi:gliding motility-associated-like protein